MELANLLIKLFYNDLENSPILSERDRRIIATRFIEVLCELDEGALRRGRGREFTIDEIWDKHLGGYNKAIIYPYVVSFFENQLNYITQNKNGKVSITETGRKHCGQIIVLPPGI